MILEKSGVRYNLNDKTQIDAFFTSGWELAYSEEDGVDGEEPADTETAENIIVEDKPADTATTAENVIAKEELTSEAEDGAAKANKKRNVKESG